MHDALTADLAAWDDRDRAASTLATATALATATTALATARATLDAARLADQAAHCAPTCYPGSRARSASSQSKPSLPGTTPATSPPRRRQLASAQSRYDEAAQEHARLDRDHRDTTAARAETLRHVETARTDLCTALPQPGYRLATNRRRHRGQGQVRPPSQRVTSPNVTTGGPNQTTLLDTLSTLSTPIAPDTARGDLTRIADAAAQACHVFDAAAESRRGLQQAVTTADTRRSSASAARRTFDRDSLDLDERSRAAATALQKTRDTVASLGAPVARHR